MIQAIQSSPALLVLAILFAITFIENVFPPSPSDVIVVMAGALITRGTIDFASALIFSTIGSEGGFLFLYYLGTQTDRKLIRTGKLKFITQESLEAAEKWFGKWGFLIILINRFLSGIRSVIGFFAGVSELNFKKVFICSTISTVVWNIVLLFLGMFFGAHINLIDKYLNVYSRVIFSVISIGIILFLIYYFIRRRGKKKPNETV